MGDAGKWNSNMKLKGLCRWCWWPSDESRLILGNIFLITGTGWRQQNHCYSALFSLILPTVHHGFSRGFVHSCTAGKNRKTLYRWSLTDCVYCDSHSAEPVDTWLMIKNRSLQTLQSNHLFARPVIDQVCKEISSESWGNLIVNKLILIN